MALFGAGRPHACRRRRGRAAHRRRRRRRRPCPRRPRPRGLRHVRLLPRRPYRHGLGRVRLRRDPAGRGAQASPARVDLFRRFDFFTGEGSNIGGFQFGYNADLPFGPDARHRGGHHISRQHVAAPARSRRRRSARRPTSDRCGMSGSVRGRIGYAANHWLYYATAGFAWAQDELTRTQINDSPFGTSGGTIETKFPVRLGWTAGAGVEMPLVPHWTARVEYLYSGYEHRDASCFPWPASVSIRTLRRSRCASGSIISWARPPRRAGNGGIAPLEGDNWAIHGQTTFVSQFAPSFHAPYRGQNSLDSNAGRETWDATLYVGVSPWQGRGDLGQPGDRPGLRAEQHARLAGFPSAEAYKLGANDPYLRVPRALHPPDHRLRPRHREGRCRHQPVRRKAVGRPPGAHLGKFSVSDIFDTVKYAHDPRGDFLNWTLVDAGTFDYAADAWGYTYGATAEWYHGPWAVRGGLFDLSKVPNSIELDRFHQFQIVYELEHRHEIAGQPGSIMFDGFVTRGRMGQFDDAIVFAQETGARRHGAGAPLPEPDRLQPQFRAAGRAERRHVRPVRLGRRQCRAL